MQPSLYSDLLESHSTLFVVHVEEDFKHFFNRTYLLRIRSLIIRPIYNRVIFLNSHMMHNGRMDELADLRGEDWEWAWGYDPEMLRDNEDELKWCIDSHEGLYTWVPPEMRGTTQATWGAVSVIGGAKHECLRSWEAVLQFCGVKYRLLDGLIYAG